MYHKVHVSSIKRKCMNKILASSVIQSNHDRVLQVATNIYEVVTKDNKTYNLVHCNWGWGGYKNGYYLSKAFDTNAGATIYDSSDMQAGSSSNYKYNLEYSIVRK